MDGQQFSVISSTTIHRAVSRLIKQLMPPSGRRPHYDRNAVLVIFLLLDVSSDELSNKNKTRNEKKRKKEMN